MEARHALEGRCQAGATSIQIDATTALCRVLGDRTMYVDARDRSLAPCLSERGCWEPWITVALQQAVQPGDRFLDVGANFGWYCLAAHDAGAKVVAAVEPSPRVAELLERTLARNEIEATVFRVAAWSQSDKTLQLEQDPENFGGMSVVADRCERVDVPSAALDDLELGPVDIVKIDVEGSEMEVWRGMQQLRAGARRVFMEFTPCSHADPMAALLEIAGDGFFVFEVQPDGSSQAVDLAAVARHPAWVMLDLVRRTP